MTGKTPDAGMENGIVGRDKVISHIIWRCSELARPTEGRQELHARDFTDIIRFVPPSSLVPSTEAIDVVPCLLTCEGDFIWGYTNDFSILFVEVALSFYELAGQKAIDEWQTRCSPKLGTGEYAEWVEVEVVGYLCDWVLLTNGQLALEEGEGLLTAKRAQRTAEI